MIRIAPLTRQDYRAAAHIWLQGWRSTAIELAGLPDEDGLCERIRREEEYGWSAYLAWQDDGPVGFLALRIAARCLDQIFLLPEAQGTGIGTALLSFAKAQLPDGFWLRTAVENRRACRFYEREGLVRGEIQVHPTQGYQTVIYRWLG